MDSDTWDDLLLPKGDMEFSHHALAGTLNPRTIHFWATIQGSPITIHNDSDSTHNFIQGAVVSWLGLAM